MYKTRKAKVRNHVVETDREEEEEAAAALWRHHCFVDRRRLLPFPLLLCFLSLQMSSRSEKMKPCEPQKLATVYRTVRSGPGLRTMVAIADLNPTVSDSRSSQAYSDSASLFFFSSPP